MLKLAGVEEALQSMDSESNVYWQGLQADASEKARMFAVHAYGSVDSSSLLRMMADPGYVVYPSTMAEHTVGVSPTLASIRSSPEHVTRLWKLLSWPTQALEWARAYSLSL